MQLWERVQAKTETPFIFEAGSKEAFQTRLWETFHEMRL